MQRAWERYSSAELERLYIVRLQVPEFQTYLDRWAASSREVRAALPGTLDLRYGEHPAERLDIFVPEGDVRNARPVQVLFHGGFWRALHKDEYSFAAKAAVDRGVVCAVVNYELCPRVTLTELVGQCGRAMAWTAAHIEEYGGDPTRVFVSGHSAGAHLAAEMLATDWSKRGHASRPTLRGACLISGLYDLAPIAKLSIQSDLRITDSEIEAHSPVKRRLAQPVPLMLATGQLESTEYHRQTADYALQCQASGARATVEKISAANHYSALDAFADPTHPLCLAWIDLMTRSD